ncbi:hypothetical protein MKW92_044984 [Papaver armeniacum]|nr:hypothetical protein MKW92_044984 [Papaver armeniacum]
MTVLSLVFINIFLSCIRIFVYDVIIFFVSVWIASVVIAYIMSMLFVRIKIPGYLK